MRPTKSARAGSAGIHRVRPWFAVHAGGDVGRIPLLGQRPALRDDRRRLHRGAPVRDRPEVSGYNHGRPGHRQSARRRRRRDRPHRRSQLPHRARPGRGANSGPRKPAVRLFWLSPTRIPAAVVSMGRSDMVWILLGGRGASDERAFFQIRAPCGHVFCSALAKSMIPICVMGDFYLSGSGYRPYSAAALDCTATFTSVRRCTQSQGHSAPGKIAPPTGLRRRAGFLHKDRPRPLARWPALG